MSRFENTPAELGEMEVKEAVLQALNKAEFKVDTTYKVYASIEHLITNASLLEVIKLIRKTIERNQDLSNQDLSIKITNELISCNCITQDTLEELGQKQLNEL